MSNDYRESHRGEGFGSHYETTLQFAWQRALLKMERAFLGKLLEARRPVLALDFACGTGRVLEFVAGRVERCWGVDISPDMLEVCRTKVPDSATIVCGDLTRDPDLVDRSLRFDLITAFRFFPNAQEGLRDEVMGELTGRLAPDGILVFNNHRNAGSMLYSIARMLRRPDMRGMSRTEARDLIRRFGLEVVEKRCFGVLPAWNRWTLAPAWLHRLTDGFVSAIGLGERLAQDVAYVCRLKKTS